MKRTMEVEKLALKVSLPDPINGDTPALEAEVDLRPADIMVTLTDGRMVALEQVGGSLRVLAWNDVSESPVVVTVDNGKPIEADRRDHVANRLDLEDDSPSP